MLTELALILCSTLASLAIAAVVARASLQPTTPSADLRRLAEAAARAAEAFQVRTRSLAVRALVGASAVAATMHAFRTTGGESPELGQAGWAIAGLLAGGAGAVVVARIASTVALRAALHGATDEAPRAEDLVLLSARAGGVCGLTADAASTGIAVMLFGLPLFLGGNTLSSRADLHALVTTATATLPGVAAGAALVGLVLHEAGSTYHASANVGGHLGVEVHAGLHRDDPRNPALVAGLVGAQVGLAAGRAVDAFVLGTLGNVAVWLVGIAAYAQSGGATLNLLTLPLVARLVGALASVFGLLTARVDANEVPQRALWRGQVVATVVAIGGVGGASLWLFGDRWPYVAGAAAAGLLGFGLAAHSNRWLAHDTQPISREVGESARLGASVTLARALAGGMAASWIPVLGLAGSAALAWEIGRASNVEGGGPLGLSTALALAVGTGVYACTMNALLPVSQAALALRSVGRRLAAVDERREDRQIDAVVLEADLVGGTYFAVVGATAAVFALLALPAGPLPSDVGPTLVGAGFLGAGAVLAFLGRNLTVAARAAGTAAVEVERQLKGFPRSPEGLAIPQGFTPTYRILVDQASKSALGGVLPPVAAALAAPLALGIGLRLLYSTDRPAISWGLAAFIVIASATGLATALSVNATRAVLGAAHRTNLPRGATPGFQTSADGTALGSLLGTTVAPGSLLLTKMLATTALFIAPLLS